MNIRRFTPEIKRIFKILDGDVGRPVSHLIHMLAGVDLYEWVRMVANGAPELEREVRAQDGGWFLMRILPYHVGTEIVSGVVLTFTDIGLLKTTREALSDREIRLSSLYRAVPVGIGRVASRMLLEVNDHLCEMLGYAREELIGQNTRFLYSSQGEFESVGKDLYEQINTQGVGMVETRWRCKDGTTLPILLNGSSLNPENPDEGATFTAFDLRRGFRHD